MTFNIYAIHDKLAGSFSNPFALDSRVAMRTFNYMTRERSEIDCADREIVKVAEWDNETGTMNDMGSLTGTSYEVVYDMEEAKKGMTE